MCIETVDLPSAQTPRGALLNSLKWRKTNLKVRFMNGDPSLQSAVKEHANEWSRHCGIKFDFGDHHPADIRISFTCGGHWSRVGIATSDLADNQPTMNLELRRSSGGTDIRRVAIHEFGHALGLIHEHQSPEARIQWDEPKVLDFYARTQGWDERKTRRNVIARQSGNFTTTDFDPESIMLYPIPNALTTDNFESGWKTRLSAKDIELIGRAYPR